MDARCTSVRINKIFEFTIILERKATLAKNEVCDSKICQCVCVGKTKQYIHPEFAERLV